MRRGRPREIEGARVPPGRGAGGADVAEFGESRNNPVVAAAVLMFACGAGSLRCGDAAVER